MSPEKTKMKALTWQRLNDITTQFGDSFYLIDLEKFQANYQQFLNAFQSAYCNSQIAYSYKTNYTPRLCQLVQKMGGYAEVVSGMEYDLAIRIGVPAERIIFNGPYKRKVDFEEALLNGSIINLDAMYEVEWVASLANRFPQQKFQIGIRCNFSMGSKQFSRFGFEVETDSFKVMVQTLRNVKNCKIAGLHCHFLPPERSVASYKKIAQQMVKIAQTEFSNDSLEFIDLGGGFYSPMTRELKQQFPYPIPTFFEYGHAIGQVFDTAFSDNDGPELILEPGISITANTMKFVTKVIDIKTIEKRNLVLVAGSQYDIKPTLSTRNLPITVYSASDDEVTVDNVFDVVGSSCMEGDYLYTGYEGKIKKNDLVVFDNVGSYTNVLRPPFINPASAILSCGEQGEIEIIRRGETNEDIFCSYLF